MTEEEKKITIPPVDGPFGGNEIPKNPTVFSKEELKKIQERWHQEEKIFSLD